MKSVYLYVSVFAGATGGRKFGPELELRRNPRSVDGGPESPDLWQPGSVGGVCRTGKTEQSYACNRIIEHSYTSRRSPGILSSTVSV